MRQIQRQPPMTFGICDVRRGLSCEPHAYLFAWIGLTPEGRSVAVLQDHVVAEERREFHGRLSQAANSDRPGRGDESEL